MKADIAAILELSTFFFGQMRNLKMTFAKVVKYDIVKHFAAFGSVLYVFFF